MTFIERSPNLISASGIVGKLFTRHDAHHKVAVEDAEPAETGDDVNDVAVPDESAEAQNFGDQSSANRLMKLIAAADAEGAGIIGIVGARRGAGASVTTRQLAGAFASFGRTVVLIDASTVPGVSASKPRAPVAVLLEDAHEVRPSLFFIDLADAMGEGTLAADDFTRAVKAAVQSGQTVIVDLPPIVCESGRPNTAIRDLAAACDLVFLVCLTGQMRRKELSECVETCKVVGVELNGLVLNDWQLPVNQLLES